MKSLSRPPCPRRGCRGLCPWQRRGCCEASSELSGARGKQQVPLPQINASSMEISRNSAFWLQREGTGCSAPGQPGVRNLLQERAGQRQQPGEQQQQQQQLFCSCQALPSRGAEDARSSSAAFPLPLQIPAGTGMAQAPGPSTTQNSP